MVTILILLFFALFFVMLLGLVKPALIIRWSNKPTRLKVLGWWVLSSVVVLIIAAIVTPPYTSEERMTMAKNSIAKGNYSSAIGYLEKIEQQDVIFSEAQNLLANAKTEDAKQKAEAEAKKKAEADAKAEAKAAETARKKAEADAKAAEAALKKAEAEALKQANAEAKAAEEARRKAEANSTSTSNTTSISKSSSDSKTNINQFGPGKWKTNIDGTQYELTLFKDGTLLETKQDGSKSIGGFWRYESKSKHDIVYKWINIFAQYGGSGSRTNPSWGSTHYVDLNGNAYTPWGRSIEDCIIEGKPTYRFTRIE